MKGLVVDKQKQISVKEMPMPTYNDYQALVKMESCGVCNGTDMKLIHHAFKAFDTYPAVLGHEGVGRVIETGKKVTSFKVGDLVLLPFLEGMTGEYYPGWGGYAEYAVVGDKDAMIAGGKGPGTPDFSEAYYAQQVVPAGIDPVDAAMIVTFREVLSAMKRFGLKENKNIVIFGAGPVGLCFTRFAKLLGLGPIVVFDIIDEKVDEALAMGADAAFNSSKVDVKSKVWDVLKDGADYVVDAVGINALINQSMELIKYNGKICCYGISPKLNMELDWSKAPYNWDVHFVQWPLKSEEAEAHEQVVNWIETGVLTPRDFISDVVPFGKIIEAFDMVEKKAAKKKIVIKFD